MAAKILLCISTENATAAVWQRGRLADVSKFNDGQQGWSALEDYLRRRPRSTISIMVDTLDEDYRKETLPHASGSDRRQLISRKLRQLFRGTPFASASLQERSTGRRREDQYLFTAVTRPELLAPWLRVINTVQVPIVGIYLLPVVTMSVIERLKLKRPNLLLVSKNESGLRQTFCKQLSMRVSRLTPSRDESEQNTAFYSEEINSTRMYLDALAVTHVDEVLTVLVLDHDGALAELPQAIAYDRPNMECMRLGPAELESNLGMKTADMTGSADALHLYLLATSRPTMNLAPPTLRTRLQVRVTGKFIYAAAAATVLVGLLWSLVSGIQVVLGDSEEKRLTQEMRSFQTRYQEVTRRFPEAPASSQVLRDSVEAAKRIDADRRTPRSLLVLLGAALQDSPTIGLKRVDWIYGSPERVPTGSRSVDFSSNLVNGIAQFGIVSAEVRSYQGDHRAALTSIRTFTRALANDKRVAQVNVLRLPLDLDPTADLNGSTASQQATQSAPFQVAVVLRAVIPEPVALQPETPSR